MGFLVWMSACAINCMSTGRLIPPSGNVSATPGAIEQDYGGKDYGGSK